MKDLIPDWRARLIDVKTQLKAEGIIGGDADLAVRITELLQTIEQPEVERGAVNHWLKGKRQPNITQFVALCTALKQRPGDIIDTNDRPAPRTATHSVAEQTALYDLRDKDIVELIELLIRAKPELRKIAIGAAKGALGASGPRTDKQTKQTA